MVPDNSTGIPRAPAYSGAGLASPPDFAYGALTLCGPPFQTARLSWMSLYDRSYNPGRSENLPVWAPPRSIASTGGIVVTFSSCGYLDVSVPRVRSPAIARVTGSLPPGCPIRRSAAITGICPSPRLFAACHVLLRLRDPRHPPCALFTTCLSFLKRSCLSLLPLRFY